MESSKLYPIVLFTYNRPWHTERVLQALKQNELADKSDLIVYIDGPRKDATIDQKQKTEEVIKIVNSENWCKTVNVHISTYNSGCRNSIIQGVTEMLESNEAVIVLEDDIITSPYFLRYMNDALNYYSVYKSVFSISAFKLPQSVLPIPADYKYDVFISYRQQNWGWGTWNDRWNQVKWDKSIIPAFLSNKHQVEAFNRGGNDLATMLSEESDGKSDAWDILFCFAHFMFHAVSIIPCNSYTNNIGMDNSGTHTINQNEKYFNNDLALCVKNPRFMDVLYEDKRIINSFYSAYYPIKRPIWKKMVNRMSRIFGGKNIFVIKKKIFY